MSFRIAREPPNQPEVHALLAAADAYAQSLYPPDSNHLLELAALLAPSVTFLVARDAAGAIGCGAVVRQDGWFEIKRMFVAPAARGKGVGRALLDQLQFEAQRRGGRLLRLETGIRQPEAIGLYRTAGFAEIGPFGAYRPDPLSLFFEKALA